MNGGDKFLDSSVLGTGLDSIENSNMDIVLGDLRVHSDSRKFHLLDGALKMQNFTYNRRSECHQSMIFQKDSST